MHRHHAKELQEHAREDTHTASYPGILSRGSRPSSSFPSTSTSSITRTPSRSSSTVPAINTNLGTVEGVSPGSGPDRGGLLLAVARQRREGLGRDGVLARLLANVLRRVLQAAGRTRFPIPYLKKTNIRVTLGSAARRACCSSCSSSCARRGCSRRGTCPSPARWWSCPWRPAPCGSRSARRWV